MKAMKLSEILKTIFDAGLQNAHFEVTYNNETIFTSDSVFYEFLKYESYKMVVPEMFMGTPAYFIATYGDFRENMKAQIYRAWKALAADYDPVSNYDMKEQSADGRKVSKETETSTPFGGTKTYVNRFGIDSGENGAPYDETTITPLENTKTERKKEMESDKSITDNAGNTLTGYHETNDHFLQRSGNIGTTQAPDMVRNEVTMRMEYGDLLQRYIKEFIDRYCYVVGGCDNDD